MKKTILPLLSFMLLGGNLIAQTFSKDSTSKQVHKGYKESIFPGGKEAWINYVQSNVNGALGKYILNPKGLPKVQQSAYVTFKVDKDGSITDVVVTNAAELNPKLVEEALRVIKSSPKWTPAMSDGEFITEKGTQTITWEHGKK